MPKDFIKVMWSAFILHIYSRMFHTSKFEKSDCLMPKNMLMTKGFECILPLLVLNQPSHSTEWVKKDKWVRPSLT